MFNIANLWAALRATPTDLHWMPTHLQRPWTLAETVGVWLHVKKVTPWA